MVRGFDAFREHFQGYEDCYTIIGGTACDILMPEAALDFRAAKDIDMILLIENRFEEFGQVFWDFIRQGRIDVAGKVLMSRIFTVSRNHSRGFRS